MKHIFTTLLLLIPLALKADHIEETTTDDKSGHSYHGGAFNEGPRQAAYIIGNTGNVEFNITTNSTETKQFFLQGLGQLHGFWYFEAERSFRQAAMTDKGCAIAYWGMAQANIDNQVRARDFIAKAWEFKGQASERERLYIEAFAEFLGLPLNDKSLAEYKKVKEKFKPKRSEKDRRKAYVRKLEELVLKYPDDLEAKAFLVVQLWFNHYKGIPVASTLAADTILQQILTKKPMHPAHHYRIHHWDRRKAEVALASAARCGFTAPSIAHMWHMSGHIYSKKQRFADAAWHQEASARTDHGHMIKDQVMPDQIHNFAHNNEWLTRNLTNLGRVDEALDLAKNMIELPRHPKYNTPKKGSANYGRRNLITLLSSYELWDDALQLANSVYLEKTELHKNQLNRLRLMGRAHFAKGSIELGDDIISQVKELNKLILAKKEKDWQTSLENYETKLKEFEKKPKKKGEKAPKKPKKSKSKNSDERLVDTLLLEMALARSLAVSTVKEELAKHKKLTGVDKNLLAHLYLAAGDFEKAVKTTTDQLKKNKGKVQFEAMHIYTLFSADRKDEAKKSFDNLRVISQDVKLQTPLFKRLIPIASEFKYPQDWRLKRERPDDILDRPVLSSLGPFRWKPSKAKQWKLQDHEGKSISLENENSDQAVLVIFYLGADCLHCVEQINAFAPMAKKYKEAGIKIIAISLEGVSSLRESVSNYSDNGKFPFLIASNKDLDIFKKYRAYDDFEKTALHGTFLIDKQGYIRWQDISYEPFTEPEFLLKESIRLLKNKVK